MAGSLPVTGTPPPLYAITGLLIVGLGATAVVLVRRIRRLRFITRTV